MPGRGGPVTTTPPLGGGALTNMGSKRNKLKKAVSPPQTQSPPAMNPDDHELMNDLMAQLDSRDNKVHAESAAVLNEMQLNKQANEIESHRKQDPKSRFQARQVSTLYSHNMILPPGLFEEKARKAAAMAQHYSPDNPEAEARLKREADLEEDTINRICDELDVRMYEVGVKIHSTTLPKDQSSCIIHRLTPMVTVCSPQLQTN